MALGPFRTIGIPKEPESPENPGGLEKRVSLAPQDVKRLVDHGADVYVERGAGVGVGFLDDDYRCAGAHLQDGMDVYEDKDLIIKLKGPSLESVPHMKPGSALLCMFHLGAFPERTRALQERHVNVIAMDNIVEAPEVYDKDILLSRVAMRHLLSGLFKNKSLARLNIRILGWSPRMVGAIRFAGLANTRSLSVLRRNIAPRELDALGPDSVYFYDSAGFRDHNGIIPFLEDKGCILFDLLAFEMTQAKDAIQKYVKLRPPRPFGLRRIQCLHETGRAGARYGFKLLREVTKKKLKGRVPRALVLGYGNVGMGAIAECSAQSVRETKILSLYTTFPGRIEPYLRETDLIVNGAVRPPKERGKRFLITSQQVMLEIAPGSVVIDLVGGSPTTRGSIEDILDNTFLDDPYFIKNDIAFSALWGWPMMGMQRESNIRYSAQIVDVLLGPERLIDGLAAPAPGVKPALVCGPFDVP